MLVSIGQNGYISRILPVEIAISAAKGIEAAEMGFSQHQV